MKTLKIIIASSIIAGASLSVTAQADELMDIIHPESADLFHYDDSLKSSEPTGIINLNDANSRGDVVWSYEYEQYVKPADFLSGDSIYSAQGINRYMEANPTAAGRHAEKVFKWDANYDGYMLQ